VSTHSSPPTPRTRIRRVAERGRYDADTIRRIVDAAWHCHVAFADENGVHCIPMACWRHDDMLYLHGSNGSRTLKALGGGAQVCVAITHLDGLVLARSAFHHSMNYRSVVIYGHCEQVAEEDKPAVLNHFMRRIAPGRELEARPGDRNELAATKILRLSLAEAAAKIREGGPKDDEADLSRPVWAGVLPFRLERLPAVRDPACQIEPPDYVRNW
jgi:nitroimidazol reductase NimA-like FMN-containing flavoprotein (pyridoxamine 5'-phosphate oxidase superfamily)